MNSSNSDCEVQLKLHKEIYAANRYLIICLNLVSQVTLLFNSENDSSTFKPYITDILA